MRPTITLIFILVFVSCNQRSTKSSNSQTQTFSEDSSGDKLYKTDADDIEMNYAIKQAKDSLFIFDKAFQDGNKNFTSFSIKKRFATANGGGEHIWTIPIKAFKNGYRGIVNNDPVNTTEIKFGDTVFIETKDISDWMFLENNILHGGYTLRVELKHMKPEEKKQFLKSLDYKIEE